MTIGTKLTNSCSFFRDCLPPIFDANPDLEEKFTSYLRKNVANLSPKNIQSWKGFSSGFILLPLLKKEKLEKEDTFFIMSLDINTHNNKQICIFF